MIKETMSERMKRLWAEGRFDNRKSHKHPDLDEVKRLYSSGYSMKEIAEEMGFTGWCIRDRIHKMKLPIHPPCRLKLPTITIPESEVELAYIAGFFDGEGTIRVYHKNQRFSASIGQKRKPVLEYIAKIFNGGTFQYTKRTEVWGWRLRRLSDVYLFMLCIYPYLIVKRKETEDFFKIVDEKLEIHRHVNPFRNFDQELLKRLEKRRLSPRRLYVR